MQKTQKYAEGATRERDKPTDYIGGSMGRVVCYKFKL
jgi:hypothetical protein